MRFDELQIHAFGHFTNYPILFDPERSFHIIYGRNEAGKSTLLRSITQLIFGIPHNSRDSFLHSNSKLRIEGKISNSAGESLDFIRRKGKSKTLLDPSGNPLNDTVLYPFINALSEETFRNMFALNHETLREGGESLLQSKGNVGESLFAAASGLNTIRKAMDNLDTESKSLYKQGGSKPPVNELIKKEKELTKKIAASQMLVRNWKELEQDYQKGLEEIQFLKEKQREIKIKIAKLTKLIKAAPKVTERQSIMEQLEQYRHIPDLPSDCQSERLSLTKLMTETEESAQTVLTEIKELQDKLAKLNVDEQFLSQESLIQSLYSRVEAFEKEQRNLISSKINSEHCQSKLTAMLKCMGCGEMDETNIEQLRLPASRKERIKSAQEQYGILKDGIYSLQKRHEAIEKQIRIKQKEIEQFGEIKNTEELKISLYHAQEEGRVEERMEEVAEELNIVISELEDGLAALPLWTGSIEDFSTLHIAILDETIEKFIHEFEMYQGNYEKTEALILTEEEKIKEISLQMEELESSVFIPTDEHLFAKRSHRDNGWEFVKNTLEGFQPDPVRLNQYKGDRSLAEKFEADLKEADEMADQMRFESEKVGMKKNWLADIKRSKEKLAQAQKELNEIKMHQQKLNDQWSEVWKETGITPLSPKEMKAWLINYKLLKKQYTQYQRQQQSKRELAERLADVKAELFAKLYRVEPLDGSVKDYTLTQLIRLANSCMDHERKRLETRKSLIIELDNKNQALREAEKELIDKGNEMDRWAASWKDAIEPLNVSCDEPINIAMEQLERYEQCIRTYDEWVEIRNRAAESETYVEDYKDKIKMISQLLNHPVPTNIPMFVHDLARNLQIQQQNRQNQIHWKDQLSKRNIEHKAFMEKLERAKADMQKLLDSAGVNNVHDLRQMEEKYALKQKYKTELSNLDKVLMEIGNGQSIHELIADIEEADMEAAEAQMAELVNEEAKIDEKRSLAEQAFGVCKKEYEEKIHGNSSAALEAAEEREGVLADLGELANQYVQKKLAAFILKRGIEHYRAKNQDPILSRASDLFSRLTLHSFEGISVDYNEKDEAVLFGVRDGEKIEIEGMSDGSKDQLYLALRVASIEKYCRESEPIPFIIDDILVHFDDERAKVTLSILEELSQLTQVIFFTHHHHLVSLLEMTVSGNSCQLIQMNKETIFSR